MPDRRIRFRLPLDLRDDEHLWLVQAITYDDARAKGSAELIGRELADRLCSKHADDDHAETIWHGLFGDAPLGLDIERQKGALALTDDNGRADPARIGILMQILMPDRLPLAFTYSVHVDEPNERFSGGAVIITDAAVTVDDADATVRKSQLGRNHS